MFCKAKILGREKVRQDPPEAYRNGVQDFYGRNFIVTPDVLIPRPETEQIIDTVLNLAGKPYLPGVKPSKRQLPDNPTIIDVGTGSGCIAITLRKEIPEANIFATDISNKAIRIAQKNAKTHGVHIPFIISHLLENVNFTPDVIVANLPYVDENWDWIDKTALAKEPKIALYADDHGLKLIKELIKESASREIKYLILEADPCQHQMIKNFAKSNQYNLKETRGFIQVFTFYKHPESH
ncbi:HemK family protein methyltransferase [Candidatus Saccharibacteria bacterium]|nr:HemK family protein methyltransferase [Candidatus Saccharibacteria bacterium]